MYAIIDIETTGTSHRNGKITEIAVYIHDGRQVTDSFVSLINPECYIPYNITRLTGISNEMVADAPKFYEVAKQLVEITAGQIFVAHNVTFDYNFVKEEFKRLGYDYRRKTLCTVQLSRKLLPGHRSYSLGNLCSDLNISIDGRHRAGGDAFATVKLFEILIQQNNEQTQNLFSNAPKELSKETLEALPGQTGVYYFLNDPGEIIYIGKSKDIHQRVLSHLANNSTKKAIEMRSKLVNVDWQITGSELVSLLLESNEIKSHQPLYNRAQRRTRFHYGLFTYQDEEGYQRFEVRKIIDGKLPLTSFYSAAEAKEYLHDLVDKYQLCQKLCGLYQTDGSCFHYEIKSCNGACIGEEAPEDYNQRAEMAAAKLQFRSPNFFILEEGRRKGEWAVVKVQNGRYAGFGYVDEENSNEGGALHGCISSRQDNRDTQGIIRSYLKKHPATRIIEFDPGERPDLAGERKL